MFSGSKVRQRQFTAMKAIWHPVYDPDTLLSSLGKYGLDEVWDQAHQHLQGSLEFRRALLVMQHGLDILMNMRGEALMGWFMDAKPQAIEGLRRPVCKSVPLHCTQANGATQSPILMGLLKTKSLSTHLSSAC